MGHDSAAEAALEQPPAGAGRAGGSGEHPAGQQRAEHKSGRVLPPESHGAARKRTSDRGVDGRTGRHRAAPGKYSDRRERRHSAPDGHRRRKAGAAQSAVGGCIAGKAGAGQTVRKAETGRVCDSDRDFDADPVHRDSGELDNEQCGAGRDERPDDRRRKRKGREHAGSPEGRQLHHYCCRRRKERRVQRHGGKEWTERRGS